MKFVTQKRMWGSKRSMFSDEPQKERTCHSLSLYLSYLVISQSYYPNVGESS